MCLVNILSGLQKKVEKKKRSTEGRSKGSFLPETFDHLIKWMINIHALDHELEENKTERNLPSVTQLK